MRRRVFLIYIFSALFLICLQFTGCGEKAEVSGGPETVVVRFFEASIAGDADTSYDLLTEASRSGISDRRELVEGFSESIDSYSVGSPKITGDRALVPVNLKLKALEPVVSFDMVLLAENGLWRISLPDSEAEMEKAMEGILKEVTPREG